MTQNILNVQVQDAVLAIRIDRAEKRNALSRSVLGLVREAFESYAGDTRLKAAVITGAGDKSFAAGGDLKDLSSVRSEADTREMSATARAALDAIRGFPLPVVAALNGDALGGGAELAVACDFRVASAHAGIGFLQSKLNISSAWGGGGDLFDILGSRKALKLLCTAEILAADAALSMGLYDAVAEPDQALDTAVAEFLAPMLKKSAQVLRAYKSMAIEARQWRGRETFNTIETDCFVRTWIHPDHWSVADKILQK